MTANLTTQYLAAEKKHKEARSPDDKLAALKEMLRELPKHKGTEKMQADLKRRIKAATEEAQQAKKKKGGSSVIHRVEPEGAGQICLVGPPSSGKSALVARTTSARVEVASYPYTTRLPQPGMLPFEDIQIQLVDLPPISETYMESWTPSVVRYSDGVLLFADLGDDDLLAGLEVAERRLSERKVRLGPPPTRPRSADEIVVLPTAIAASKLDLPAARDNLEVVRELYGARLPVLPFSSETGEGLEALARALFELRDIVRVYTKQPGKKPDMEHPFVVDRGSTVTDLARRVHKEVAERLAFARIWSETKPDGLRVPRDYVVEDEDVIELHA